MSLSGTPLRTFALCDQPRVFKWVRGSDPGACPPIRGVITLLATSQCRRSPRIVKFVLASTIFAVLINLQYHWHARRFVLEIDRAWRRYKADEQSAE